MSKNMRGCIQFLGPADPNRFPETHFIFDFFFFVCYTFGLKSFLNKILVLGSSVGVYRPLLWIVGLFFPF